MNISEGTYTTGNDIGSTLSLETMMHQLNEAKKRLDGAGPMSLPLPIFESPHVMINKQYSFLKSGKIDGGLRNFRKNTLGKCRPRSWSIWMRSGSVQEEKESLHIHNM